jgi:hypothetical protein
VSAPVESIWIKWRMFIELEEFCLLGYNAVYPLKFKRRFGRTYRLHLQNWRASQARNQHETGSKRSWFLAWLTFQPWRWRRHVPPIRRLALNLLGGVISQEIELFITTTTAVKTSDPTVQFYWICWDPRQCGWQFYNGFSNYEFGMCRIHVLASGI